MTGNLAGRGPANCFQQGCAGKYARRWGNSRQPKPATRPEPGPGQVRVRVAAVSLNYRDLLMVRGHYDPRLRLPVVPVSDGVGTIEALGPGVQGPSVGDRVAGMFVQRWFDGPPTPEALRTTLGGPRDGMLAEQVLLDADGVAPVPEHLGDLEAATLPCAALTAWSALVTLGRVRAGDTVLVQGTGGVSTFALDFARLHGARVIATTGSPHKVEGLRARGAWEVLDHRADPSWGKTARALTEGRGVDHVVEVGGVGTLAQSIRALRPGGTVSLIGVLAGGQADLSLTPVLMNQMRIQGVFVGHRAGFGAMTRAIEQHRLRPLVDRVFDFGEARAAFEHLASGAHQGKVCIRVGS
ncbi:MAG: NAD(P)-dependent alcohol dehydrogenase [Myxococcales bacterium]|nr:NAD(P)-dependent alcohol dehydrogenase [Myxococcales bacterium]